ncbi:MAG: tRNA (guanosine(46)-N7)-methyltransferase TrmB [Pseudobdellovibrionaceae bacterium]
MPQQNRYTLALENEFKDHAFSEVRGPLNKGKWRSQVFKVDENHPLDLEIGTGIGRHFTNYCEKNPDRCLIGIEVKYKPLIQAIRRTLENGSRNGVMVRFHAFNIEELFAENEIDRLIVHFPDPWTSPRKPKNRVMRKEMLDKFHNLQKQNSVFEFKTDSKEYFDWALEEVKGSKYNLEFVTDDLHNSEIKETNFITTFEQIFLKKGQPIFYFRLRN